MERAGSGLAERKTPHTNMPDPNPTTPAPVSYARVQASGCSIGGPTKQTKSAASPQNLLDLPLFTFTPAGKLLFALPVQLKSHWNIQAMAELYLPDGSPT